MPTTRRTNPARAIATFFTETVAIITRIARLNIVRLAGISLLLSGCALFVASDFDKLYGTSRVRERDVPIESPWGIRYRSEIQPIIEKRCVVCHGCYDAPCQLLLSSSAGIQRGASRELVYNGMRLGEARMSRLIDAPSTAAWREREFHSVLNERDQSGAANLHASLFFRMLELKRQHPLPEQELLPEDFSLELNRKQQCSSIEEFDGFSTNQPLWGMPYALPGVAPREFNALREWISAGAPMVKAIKPSEAYQRRVAQWEEFLNRDSLRAQLVNRYIYEHLFLGHLYFDDLPATHFFSLVRSSTPPGAGINIIATRRPYDDPGVERVYYRLQPVEETVLAKTHMPYALGEKRMKQWQQWFFDTPYSVTSLPPYGVKIGSNPFAVFAALPPTSRYRFMLDHAQFTIDGFIKGPVCRGQVALNVINDRFWVFFFKPGLFSSSDSQRFLARQSERLGLPAGSADAILPITHWIRYSRNQENYLKAKYEEINRTLDGRRKLSMDLVWDGDGSNPNAALTVFRNFDSASVVQGLVGEPPRTAWVIDYPILERIHYLLVAGFDVYGNIEHQLLTRLYMDFLRMEGEFNFLMFLPQNAQEREWESWYDGAPSQVRDYAKGSRKYFRHQTDLAYKTTRPKQELYGFLTKRVSQILGNTYSLRRSDVPANHRLWLEKLGEVRGTAASLLPETTVVTIESRDGVTRLYTVLRNSAHSNISSLLREQSNRRPERDDLTVARGIVGSYPSAFWNLRENDLPVLVESVINLRTEEDYRKLMRDFGIRRTNERFWAYSDKLHTLYERNSPVEYGLLDYNRLENR